MDSDPTCTDDELLRAWSGGGCQQSFRALVGKYFGLVHGLALRRTGNASLADEIAQTVFARLAVRAGSITARPTLAPWLHHCAWCETASALRRESTHRRHMNDYADHLRSSQGGSSAAALNDALPHLDEALRSLPGEDQRIVLMRFYEGRGLRDIASAMGKTEAAVRKQGQRALEKMALRLKHCGTGLSAATLAAGLGAVLSQPASAATVVCVATTATAALSAKLTLLDHLLILMNTKAKTVVITAACMAVPLAWQWQRASGMEDRLARAEKDAPSMRGRLNPADSSSNDIPQRRSSRGAGAATSTVSHVAASRAADWEAALKNPDPLVRSQRLAALMASLDARSAPEVAELFKRLRSGEGGEEYEAENRQFLRAWGRLDGAAALAACADPDGKVGSSGEALAALAGWAQVSPEKARAWLEAMEPGENQTNLALGMIDGWSLTDLDAASAYAANLPRSGVRDQFISLLLQRALATGGMPEAERWFASVPGDEHNTVYKEHAFDQFIKAMTQRDPAAAASWVIGMGRQSYMNGDGIPEIAARLATSSPEEAIRLLETLGMGEGEAVAKTSKGYGNALEAWSKSDPAAASEWLRNHSGHPAYDNMAAALSSQVAATDGTAALAWADSIQDPDARSRARDDAARSMLQAQGDAANLTLAAAGYSEQQIDVLRDTGAMKVAFDSLSYRVSNTTMKLDNIRTDHFVNEIRLTVPDAGGK